MKKLTTLAALLAATTALAGCNRAAAPAANNAAAPAPANAARPAPANSAAASNAAAPAGNSASPYQTHSFRLTNNSQEAIVALYVGPVADDTWGDDVFQGEPLAPGESTEIEYQRAAGECRWDLRVEVRGGQSHELRNVDMCAPGGITYGPQQ